MRDNLLRLALHSFSICLTTTISYDQAESDLAQRISAAASIRSRDPDESKLMGVSVESVHTTRYRLRKKLGLERKDNLVEFIAEV